jgi:hypothetical protein
MGSKLYIDIGDLNFQVHAYTQIPAHLNIVVLNEALVYELKKRFSHLQVYGLNPGLIETGIRDNLHGGASTGWLGWAVEKAIAVMNPTAKQYVDRTVLPMIANAALFSPMSYSQDGKPLAAMGWVAEESNRERAWEVSEEIVKRVSADDDPAGETSGD